jgi:uncharacterized protein YecE (DUF72 family)
VPGRIAIGTSSWADPGFVDDQLREIAGRAQELATHVRDVRVVFNDNRGRDAPDAAQRFKELMS